MKRHSITLRTSALKMNIVKKFSVLLLLAVTACSGDDLFFVDLSGQAVFPREFTGSLGAPVAVANSPFFVVDLALPADQNVVATGLTDAQGKYLVTVPVTFSAAVVVLGEVRVSGLIDPRDGSKAKDFNGVTDVACQAGKSAVDDGTITAFELDDDRIANLEAGAAVVLQQTTVDFTDADGSRSAAARQVREITNNGANPPA